MVNGRVYRTTIFGLAALILIFCLLVACRYYSPANHNSNVAENLNSNTIETDTKKTKVANTKVLDNKTIKDAKLQAESDVMLKLFGNMPSVPVYVRDEPQLKTGSETQKGVAYTACENKKDPTIYVKKVFYDKANPKMLKNIVKHELVHAWFCRQGEIIGHDERFRRKFKEVGGIGN